MIIIIVIIAVITNIKVVTMMMFDNDDSLIKKINKAKTRSEPDNSSFNSCN